MTRDSIEIFTLGARLDAATRKRLSRPAILAFSRAMAAWHLDRFDTIQLAGAPSPTIFDKWLHDATCNADICLHTTNLQRLGAIVDIQRRISTFLPDPDLARRWLHSPSLISPGSAPLTRLGNGSLADILSFRDQLVARLSTWPLAGISVIALSKKLSNGDPHPD